MGYLFYKCAYREVRNAKLEEIETLNQPALEEVFTQKPTYSEIGQSCFPYPVSANGPGKKLNEQAMNDNNIFVFRLKVLYPGVYAGLGYMHGLRSKDDIKTGFSFDYTTGLPYIPASSLKGTLRSLFMNQPDDVAEALQKDKHFVRKLEDVLFGSRNGSKEHEQGLLVCYDVFPFLNNTGRALIKKDFITPHEGDFTPPNPINTASITPETQLTFLFSLPETIEVEGIVLPREKISALFKSLLIDWGIGAKTNSGYGTLDETLPQRKG